MSGKERERSIYSAKIYATRRRARSSRPARLHALSREVDKSVLGSPVWFGCLHGLSARGNEERGQGSARTCTGSDGRLYALRRTPPWW